MQSTPAQQTWETIADKLDSIRTAPPVDGSTFTPVLKFFGAYQTGTSIALFGWKETKLRRRICNISTRPRTRKDRIVAALMSLAVRGYDFITLSLFFAAAVILASVARHHHLVGDTAKWTSFLLCIGLAATILAICVESTFAFVFLDSYGGAYQNAPSYASAARPPRAYIAELGTLVGAGLAAIFVDTFFLFDLRTTGLIDSPTQPNVQSLFDSLYDSALTLTFSSPFEASGNYAKLFVLLVTAQAVALLIVAIMAFSSSQELT